MNYFALAGGIFAAIITLFLLSQLVLVAVGKARFRASGALTVRALAIALLGTTAVWLFSIVIG